jgi:hypothetical protein
MIVTQVKKFTPIKSVLDRHPSTGLMILAGDTKKLDRIMDFAFYIANIVRISLNFLSIVYENYNYE